MAKHIMYNINTKVLFIALTGVYLLHAAVRWLDIPAERIATHFSTDGTPTDGTTGTGFMLFHVIMAGCMLGIRAFIAASARWQQGINLPEYHAFTNEQKQAFTGFMASHSWSFGCLMMAMLLAIDGIILLANSQTPVVHPLVIILMLIAFVGDMMWWIIRLLLEVQRIKKSGM